jgi:hypothetical protein
MNSNEMRRYCEDLTELMWDTGRADDLLARAARAVDEVAAGNFHRDNIRTEPFTHKVIAYCRSQSGSGAQ